MTSRAEFNLAKDMADDFAEADQALQNRTMLSVAECNEYPYDTWCYLRGLDPEDSIHIQHYSILLALFVTLWNRIGDNEFFVRLERARAVVKMLRR